MYGYYNQIFIGMLLTIISITINDFKFFPEFIGFSIIFFAINKLYNKTKSRDFKLSSVFLSIFIVINIFEFLSNYNFTLSNNNLLNIVFNIATIFHLLYFFYLVKASINLFDINRKRIIELLKYYLILKIIGKSLFIINSIFLSEFILVITSILIITSLAIEIYIIYFYRKISKKEIDN